MQIPFDEKLKNWITFDTGIVLMYVVFPLVQSRPNDADAGSTRVKRYWSDYDSYDTGKGKNDIILYFS